MFRSYDKWYVFVGNPAKSFSGRTSPSGGGEQFRSCGKPGPPGRVSERRVDGIIRFHRLLGRPAPPYLLETLSNFEVNPGIIV